MKKEGDLILFVRKVELCVTVYFDPAKVPHFLEKQNKTKKNKNKNKKHTPSFQIKSWFIWPWNGYHL